jgi:hypothetical protein
MLWSFEQQNSSSHAKTWSGTPAQPSPCHPCIASKITHCPFQKSAEPWEWCPLDLLHMDIDIVNVPGQNGEKYFLFFNFGSAITSHSGQVIIDCLLNILPYMEHQTGETLIAICSDNALEFCSGIFPAKLKQLGISHEHRTMIMNLLALQKIQIVQLWTRQGLCYMLLIWMGGFGQMPSILQYLLQTAHGIMVQVWKIHWPYCNCSDARCTRLCSKMHNT